MCGAQFSGIRAAAADLGQSVGSYTAAQFKEEYSQFCDADGKCFLPDVQLDELVKMANASIQPDKWLDSWHYAVGLYQEKVNQNEYISRIIVAATLEPDFASAEVCEHFGTKDPIQVPGKMLLAGEFAKLSAAILELSGFEQNLDDEAKN